MNFEDWTIIKSKDPNFVLKVFLKHWISQFDSLKSLFSDNGGEFVWTNYIDSCENFDIKVKITTTEEPWNNDICKYHNAILTDIIV